MTLQHRSSMARSAVTATDSESDATERAGRTVTEQAPAIIIALVALMVSLGGAAWATTRSPAAHSKTGIYPKSS